MTYTVKFWRLFTSGFLIFIPFLGTCYLLTTISATDSLSEKLFFIILMLPFGGLVGYLLNRYFNCAKQVLEISVNDNIFYFGNNINRNKFTKDDIEKVTIYQPDGGPGKAFQYFYVYEILFKDGLTIKFSNLLISEADVLSNFSSDLIRYGGDKHSFWRL